MDDSVANPRLRSTRGGSISVRRMGLLAIWLTVGLVAARYAEAGAYAFIGVNVVTMNDERIVADQTVLIVDGRIERIAPADEVTPPEGTFLIRAQGAYVLPGLAEMHAHIPPVRDRGGWLEDALFLYVANGVTTARGMLGEPFHLELRDLVASQEILGPRIFTSGPSLNGNSVDGAGQARSMVEAQARAGYDFVKLHPGLSREEFDAVVTTAGHHDIPFAGHVGADVGLTRALAARQATIDHLDGYMRAMVPPGTELPASIGFFGAALVPLVDTDRIPMLARETAAAGVWNVPTQALIESFVLPEDPDVTAARPEMAYVPRPILRRWVETKRRIVENPDYDPQLARRFVAIRATLIAALDEAGAGLLLGSDAPQVFNVPGFSIHRELDTLVSAGLSPYEALRTGTVEPARFFGRETVFGSLTEGLDADLVLVAADPLTDVTTLRRPLGVMVRGRWLSREALDERLDAIRERYSQD